MTAKSKPSKPQVEKVRPALARDSRRNGSSADTEEPRPWLTEEDAEGWRVRSRGKDAAAAGVGPRKIRQSVLVELDDDEIAWLDRRAEEVGLTLAGTVKQLIEQARED